MQKYFYLVINATRIEEWLDEKGNYCSWLLKSPGPCRDGYKTRAVAREKVRARGLGVIHQFENNPPYKYVKQVS
jgi:hypothetical protein